MVALSQSPIPSDGLNDWLDDAGDFLADLGNLTNAPAASETPATGPAMQSVSVSAADRFVRGSSIDAAVQKLDATSFETPWDLRGASEILPLTRPELRDYSSLMTRVLDGAQLSHRFVDAKALRQWFAALDTLSLAPGDDEFDLQVETGMPSQTLWAALVAAQALSNTTSTYRALMRTSAQAFATLPELKLESITTKVLDNSNGFRTFEVSLPRYKHPGFIVRTAFEIRQSVTATGPLKLVFGEWKLPDALAKILDVSSTGSLATLALAAKQACGDAVVAATQGIIGPMFFDGVMVPEGIAEILDAAPGSAIATFTEFELRANQPPGHATWLDEHDASLVEAYQTGWSGLAKKTWVCSPTLEPALTKFAFENDGALTVRPFT